ncbi:hypothetical protein DAI22_10g092100 [Oryza sativa Japonica Group]|nr:hypothetical protein DAI22_10g092100 [Oryza sativa Japonica Group]
MRKKIVPSKLVMSDAVSLSWILGLPVSLCHLILRSISSSSQMVLQFMVNCE